MAGRSKNPGEHRAELEQILGHRFERPELLTLALTHRSFVYDTPGVRAEEDRAELRDPSRDNEQLEFMGDAALGLLAAEALCQRYPGSREGELTRMRSAVVSRKHLGDVGCRLGLGRWLLLGPTAERDHGRSNPLLHANAMEALIAALYLDGGLEPARRFVEAQVLGGELESLMAGEDARDWKTTLKEMLEAEGKALPVYRLVDETGPGHRKLFRMEVKLGDERTLAQAEGSTKKQAQQEAARLAVGMLQKGADE